MAQLPAILTFLGLVIPAALGAWMAWMKIRADRDSAEDTRTDNLARRLDDLEKRFDEEASARRAAETRAHTLSMALRDAITYISRVSSWIRTGAVPPPPSEPDLDSMHAALGVPRPPT